MVPVLELLEDFGLDKIDLLLVVSLARNHHAANPALHNLDVKYL